VVIPLPAGLSQIILQNNEDRKMNAIKRLEAAIVVACIAALGASPAGAWWDDDDDYYDRWYDGPWYGGYPGYGWGGYPGYWGGYPGYGWAGYPGYGWGGHPGYGAARTIIVYPQTRNDVDLAPPEPYIPR